MSGLDWTIVGIYCAAILGVAWHFRMRASKCVEAFFVADRDLPWWVIGFADVASYTGGGQAFVMVFFLSGFAGLWLMAWISWVIWMPLVAVLWAPMWRRIGVVTTGEFIQRRYAGSRAAIYRNVYAVYACLAWGVTSLAYVSAWMVAATAPVLGWSATRVLVVFGGLTIVYCLVSGLFAVAYNDCLQFLVLMVGNSIFGWLLLSKTGGFTAAIAKAEALRGAGFLEPWPGSGALTAGSLLALCLQGLFFAGSPFAGEGWTAQRYMAARSVRHAVAGQMLNGLLALVIRLIPFLLIGIAAAAIYKPSDAGAPAALWGNLVREHAPAGLFGLLLVCSLAGYMASISSLGNWAASYIVNDLYLISIRPKASEKQVIRISRIVTAVVLVAAFAWGARISFSELEKWVLFINSALAVFPLPLAWLKWFWWRTNAAGDMVGILGAFPASYVVWFGSDSVLPEGVRAWFLRVCGWDAQGFVPAFGDLGRYQFWVGFSILFGLGWLAILIATLITRPEPFSVLKEFYVSARPIGLWGPVRRALDAGDSTDRAQTRSILGACVFGILFYFSSTVTCFALLGRKSGALAVAGPLCLIAGLLFAWTVSREYPSKAG